MNREETIKFLEKEIEMYKKLIEQEERLIKIIPNRSDVFLEDNKDTLRELTEELKELKEQ
jgi:NAD(P)H-nitrite reductase large subunit